MGNNRAFQSVLVLFLTDAESTVGPSQTLVNCQVNSWTKWAHLWPCQVMWWA